jgi:hypothetical protein
MIFLNEVKYERQRNIIFVIILVIRKLGKKSPDFLDYFKKYTITILKRIK